MLLPTNIFTSSMTDTKDKIAIPDRSRPDKTTAFFVGHQGGNAKNLTGAKLSETEDITIATRNGRTLSAAGKLEELLYDIDRYKSSEARSSGELQESLMKAQNPRFFPGLHRQQQLFQD